MRTSAWASNTSPIPVWMARWKGMIPRKAIGGRTSRAKNPKGCPNAEVWATFPSATRALDRVLRNSVARPWASAVVVDLAVWSVNCSVVMNVTANCRCRSAS